MPNITLTGTSASSTSSGVPWTNANGFFGTNSGTPALVSINMASPTSQILADGGYPTNQIPLGVTIVGILYGASISGSGATLNFVKCSINGKIDTSNVSQALTGSFAAYGAGSSVTIPSGLSTVTPADINTGIISVLIQGTTGSTATIDAYLSSITIYWTVPPQIAPPIAYVVKAAYVARD